MSRRQLYGDLSAVRALVADGLSHLDGTVGELDQYWLNSARARLRSVDGFLVAAAGGTSGWTRTGISAVAMLLTGWATAAGTIAVGFSPAWVIVTTVFVAALVDLPVRKVTFPLADALDRRRLARAAQPSRAGLSADRLGPDGLGAARLGAARLGADGLGAVLEPLLQARVRLVSAGLRQVDSRRWRSPYLAHLAAEHRSIRRIAEADVLLCQAIDYLEIYLDEHTKEPG